MLASIVSTLSFLKSGDIAAIAKSPVFAYADLVRGLKEQGLKLAAREVVQTLRDTGFVKRRLLIDGRKTYLYRRLEMTDTEARAIRLQAVLA